MNYNGTKVVWKDALGEGFDKEMKGVTPLMLAIMFVPIEDVDDMVNSLISNDDNTGDNNIINNSI